MNAVLAAFIVRTCPPGSEIPELNNFPVSNWICLSGAVTIEVGLTGKLGRAGVEVPGGQGFYC